MILIAPLPAVFLLAKSIGLHKAQVCGIVVIDDPLSRVQPSLLQPIALLLCLIAQFTGILCCSFQGGILNQ
jgi:hypothetical protein